MTSTGVLLQETGDNGGLLHVSLVEAPSSPNSFEPQHLTPPGDVMTQLWLPPDDRAATPVVRPDTSTGVVRCDCVPSELRTVMQLY